MELEERVTEQIDRERAKDAILNFEIDQLREAIKRAEAIERV